MCRRGGCPQNTTASLHVRQVFNPNLHVSQSWYANLLFLGQLHLIVSVGATTQRSRSPATRCPLTQRSAGLHVHTQRGHRCRSCSSHGRFVAAVQPLFPSARSRRGAPSFLLCVCFLFSFSRKSQIVRCVGLCDARQFTIIRDS